MDLDPNWNQYVDKGVYTDPYPIGSDLPSISASTQPTQSSFDWIKGIEAIGGLAQDIGKGIYLAKGYQPGPYMGAGGFSGETDRASQETDIEEFISELLEKAMKKKEEDIKIRPLYGSQSVV